MNKARSIKQIGSSDALPNFRNLGVTLRILLASVLLALLLAVLQSSQLSDIPQRGMEIAIPFTPILLSSLLVLWGIQPVLNRLSYLRGAMVVASITLVLTLLVYFIGGFINVFRAGGSYFFNALRFGLLSIIVCMVILLYFWIRSRVLSRALHDARLQALRARIRPHFLFNTINTVLSIIRAQPKEAENALENMADLFRVAMTDMKDLVPVQREIQLSRQYAEIEQLRMGKRLNVNWQVYDLPDDALIPPLLLQPLLENAVYHGIEPLPQGGNIDIVLRRLGDKLQITVDNPCPKLADRNRMGDTTGAFDIAQLAQQMNGKAPHLGNKMALKNIRERMALLFDIEAHYKVETGDDFYRVEIVMPYVKELPL